MGSSFKIRRITIEGFRRIQEKLTLDLVDPKDNPVDTFVIAGPNGCGKTSVLEAILYGLDSFDVLNTIRSRRPDNRSSSRVHLPKEARIVIRGEHSVLGSIEYTLSAQHGVVVSEVQGHQIDPSIAYDRELHRPKLLYFSSDRAQTFVGSILPLDSRQSASCSNSEMLWRLKELIINERATRGFGTPRADPMDEMWLRQLNAAWQTFHQDDGNQIVADLESRHVNDSLGGRRADLYVTRDGRRVCSIDLASSGEIEIVTLAGTLITCAEVPSIVLIDEPELHLHPQWQATILPALRKLAPDAQFIVATHADAPWDAAMSYERVLLVPDRDPRSKTWREAHSSVRETPDD